MQRILKEGSKHSEVISAVFRVRWITSGTCLQDPPHPILQESVNYEINLYSDLLDMVDSSQLNWAVLNEGTCKPLCNF
jgi:hypothetical protein